MPSDQETNATQERLNEIEQFFEPHLKEKDRRKQHKINHTLAEIFFLVLCAQLSNFDTLREYVLYGNTHINFLKQFFQYKNGIPSISTITRVLALVAPAKLEQDQIFFMAKEASKDLICLDGKTHRGYKAQEGTYDPLHSVSAFSTTNGLCLGLEKVADKSNEITAIPKLIKRLDVAGQIIMMDAMGCQKDIAKTIREEKADYILALKLNHKNLHDDVVHAFKNEDFLRNASKHEIWRDDHGRTEHQIFTVISDLEWLESQKDWQDLQTIIMVESERIVGDKTSQEKRYYLSSLRENAEDIGGKIRDYWGIENKYHWVLDVIFKEDQRILWNKNFARNEAVIRRIGFNLLKQFQTLELEKTGKKIALKSLRKVFMHNFDTAVFLIHSFFSQICGKFS